MASPTKRNQKFTNKGNTHTVLSFFGRTGEEYSTLRECKSNNEVNTEYFVKTTYKEIFTITNCKLI